VPPFGLTPKIEIIAEPVGEGTARGEEANDGLDQVVVIRVTKDTCPPTKSVQLEVGTGRRTVRRQLIQLTPAPL
jgi:hypothetical protein